MSKGAKRLAYDRWVSSQPKPKPKRVIANLMARERGTAVSFPDLMAATGSPEGPRRRGGYVQPSVGLTEGVDVAVTFVVGKVARGLLVAFTPEAVAFRRSANGAVIWVPWRKIRSVRAGPDGPRHRSKPQQTQAIMDLMRERGPAGTLVPAHEAMAALWDAYGWSRDSVGAARRRTNCVDAVYRADLDPNWWWVMRSTEPKEQDHDE